jgi:hypothetical protein
MLTIFLTDPPIGVAPKALFPSKRFMIVDSMVAMVSLRDSAVGENEPFNAAVSLSRAPDEPEAGVGFRIDKKFGP